MSKKHFICNIPVDIYNTNVALHITNDKKSIEKLEKAFDEKIEDNDEAGVFPPEACPVLWLRRKPRTADQIGTLAHEAGHAAMGILKSRGMSINSKTEEAYCYLQGFLVKSILTEIRKNDKSNKTKISYS